MPRGPAVDGSGFKIGRSALYGLLRTRNLASLTVGRARRIPTHALDDYIQRHLEEATR